MTKLLHPENKAIVELRTDCQKNFTGGQNVGEIDWINLKRGEGEDCTFPRKVVFSWESDRANSDHFKSFMAALDTYGTEESSIHEKAVRFLKSCGITDETLDRLRRNLLI